MGDAAAAGEDDAIAGVGEGLAAALAGGFAERLQPDRMRANSVTRNSTIPWEVRFFTSKVSTNSGCEPNEFRAGYDFRLWFVQKLVKPPS